MNNSSVYRLIQQLLQQGTPHVLVTLIDVQSSAPQDVGAKIVVTQEGLIGGTVGGGKIEAFVITQAQKMLQTGEKHRFETWNLQTDIGMTCGGVVRFFFESYNVAVWNICVFGAGHVAQALVPLLCQLDCRVYCVDPRQEWLDKFEPRDNLMTYHIEDPEEAIAAIPSGAFVAMMTKGHSTDVPILKKILASGVEYPYLGMIGSETKAFRVRKELLQAGFSEEQVKMIRSPIGLKLGSNHPVEIAVSVAGEMIMIRDRE